MYALCKEKNQNIKIILKKIPSLRVFIDCCTLLHTFVSVSVHCINQSHCHVMPSTNVYEKYSKNTEMRYTWRIEPNPPPPPPIHRTHHKRIYCHICEILKIYKFSLFGSRESLCIYVCVFVYTTMYVFAFSFRLGSICECPICLSRNPLVTPLHTHPSNSEPLFSLSTWSPELCWLVE